MPRSPPVAAPISGRLDNSKEEGSAFIADILSPFSPGTATESVALPSVFCFLKGGRRLRAENAATPCQNVECAVLIYFLIQTHLCMWALAKKKIGSYEILTKEVT